MADCSNEASTPATFSGKFHELSDIIIGALEKIWDVRCLKSPAVMGIKFGGMMGIQWIEPCMFLGCV